MARRKAARKLKKGPITDFNRQTMAQRFQLGRAQLPLQEVAFPTLLQLIRVDWGDAVSRAVLKHLKRARRGRAVDKRFDMEGRRVFETNLQALGAGISALAAGLVEELPQISSTVVRAVAPSSRGAGPHSCPRRSQDWRRFRGAAPRLRGRGAHKSLKSLMGAKFRGNPRRAWRGSMRSPRFCPVGLSLARALGAFRQHLAECAALGVALRYKLVEDGGRTVLERWLDIRMRARAIAEGVPERWTWNVTYRKLRELSEALRLLQDHQRALHDSASEAFADPEGEPYAWAVTPMWYGSRPELGRWKRVHRSFEVAWLGFEDIARLFWPATGPRMIASKRLRCNRTYLEHLQYGVGKVASLVTRLLLSRLPSDGAASQLLGDAIRSCEAALQRRVRLELESAMLSTTRDFTVATRTALEDGWADASGDATVIDASRVELGSLLEPQTRPEPVWRAQIADFARRLAQKTISTSRMEEAVRRSVLLRLANRLPRLARPSPVAAAVPTDGVLTSDRVKACLHYLLHLATAVAQLHAPGVAARALGKSRPGLEPFSCPNDPPYRDFLARFADPPYTQVEFPGKSKPERTMKLHRQPRYLGDHVEFMLRALMWDDAWAPSAIAEGDQSEDDPWKWVVHNGPQEAKAAIAVITAAASSRSTGPPSVSDASPGKGFGALDGSVVRLFACFLSISKRRKVSHPPDDAVGNLEDAYKAWHKRKLWHFPADQVDSQPFANKFSWLFDEHVYKPELKKACRYYSSPGRGLENAFIEFLKGGARKALAEQLPGEQVEVLRELDELAASRLSAMTELEKKLERLGERYKCSEAMHSLVRDLRRFLIRKVQTVPPGPPPTRYLHSVTDAIHAMDVLHRLNIVDRLLVSDAAFCSMGWVGVISLSIVDRLSASDAACAANYLHASFWGGIESVEYQDILRRVCPEAGNADPTRSAADIFHECRTLLDGMPKYVSCDLAVSRIEKLYREARMADWERLWLHYCIRGVEGEGQHDCPREMKPVRDALNRDPGAFETTVREILMRHELERYFPGLGV